MLNINIYHSTPNRRANVQREGNTITVSDPSHKECRCPGDFYYSLEMQEDSIKLSGSDNEKGRVNYTLRWNSNGVTVENANDTRRLPMSVESDTDLTPSQQKALGVNVVSSIIGIPLII